MNITDSLMANTTTKSIKEPNRVREISKCEDGGLLVTQKSGRTLKISKDDELIQAFIVYSVLAEL